MQLSFFFLLYLKLIIVFYLKVRHKITYKLSLDVLSYLWVYFYCSCNQDKNLTKDTDSITIGIELCNIPQISEHWP